jgi:SAM-dependent methyltransferase
MEHSSLAARLAAGPPLASPPGVVDIGTSTPPNPPEAIQVQFVGLSFEKAYAEAEAFVAAVDDALADLGRPGLAAGQVLDFGSGWGRISRVLLAHDVPPARLFAADVDPEMTALMNVTLPGVNAMTVTPSPPTVLAAGSMDVVTAFSVFSHLSADAHEAWARELGRVLRPGGVAAVTLLGEDFIDLVEGSQAAVARGGADGFTTSMATVFDDPRAARAGFRADRLQFGATGGGGVRTSDYYGWAVASRRFVERVWGDAGFELVRWRPSGELFPQALAVLVRTDGGRASRWGRRARRQARHATARAVERTAGRVRARIPAPLVAGARRLRHRGRPPATPTS